MALSPTKEELGHLNKAVVTTAAMKRNRGAILIFSNRFPVGQESLAEEARRYALFLRVPSGDILIPHPPQKGTKNTWGEVEFAAKLLTTLFWGGEPRSLLVVADSIHMRRVVATSKKLAAKHDVTLYWESVRAYDSYGRGYVQKRFLHPLFFLGYEMLAYLYSKTKGWV